MKRLIVDAFDGMLAIAANLVLVIAVGALIAMAFTRGTEKDGFPIHQARSVRQPHPNDEETNTQKDRMKEECSEDDKP